MGRVGIRHLSFTLGDQRVWYRDLPDVEEKIRRLNIPDEEDLWNWGYCRRSSGDYDGHVGRGFSELIAHLGAERLEIDAVLGCGPFQNSTPLFTAALAGTVLPRIATPTERLRLVEDRECVNVLQALADARELIGAGCRNVLVLAAEKVEDERARFRQYSVFSDFCLALVVSGEIERLRYEILDVHVRRDSDPGEDTKRILTRELERDCVSGLLAANGLTLAGVDRFFYLNLFEPIAEMKGKDIGFAPSQLYTRAIKECGHCYGADPLINMHTYFAGGGDGDLFVLCASGRQHAGASLMRRLR